VRIWLESRNESERIARYDAFLKRSDDFNQLLKITQTDLRELYSQELDSEQKREQKKAVFEKMQGGYAQLKESWGGYSGYDGWFSREVNNARLLSVATYRKWVPAFEAIYKEHGLDMEKFYAAATKLSKQPKAQRQKILSDYLAKAADS